MLPDHVNSPKGIESGVGDPLDRITLNFKDVYENLTSTLMDVHLELNQLRALREAVRSWRDEYLIPKYGQTDWKCPYVRRMMDALTMTLKETD